MATNQPKHQELPAKGLCRFNDFERFIVMSRSSFLALVKDGKAPQPQRLSERMSVYKNEDIHRFIDNPVGFKQ